MSRDEGMGMGGKSGGGSSGNSGNGGGNRESYAGGGQYSGGTKSTGGNGGTPPDRPTIADITGDTLPGSYGAVDPGDAGDWNVNPKTGDLEFTPSTDTIKSFDDNLRANIASNPFSILTPTSTLLGTALQTARARNMMGYGFNLGTSYGGDGDTTDTNGGGDGELSRQQMNELVSYAPYLMSGTPTSAPKSMVNEYFENLSKSQADFENWSPGKPAPEGYRVVNMLGDTFLERESPSIQEMLMLPSPLSSSLQTGYNNAKNNISSILGTNQQFGYSTAPYGLLSSTNLADNPFNIEYLQQRGLI